jgi:putative membrane protein
MMGNGWGMGWMWVIWPLVIFGIVLLVVFLVRGATARDPGHGGEAASPRDPDSGRSRALEILDERYARGEITDEEYQERRRHLRGESGR